MTRRESREHILKLLFLREFHDAEDVFEQNDLYLDSVEKLSDRDRTYILNKYNDIISRCGELDAMLTNATSGWRLNRIGKIEVSILRLSSYEIKFDDTVPDSVAINEAVELAKLYGGASAYGFVNGILGKVAKAVQLTDAY